MQFFKAPILFAVAFCAFSSLEAGTTPPKQAVRAKSGINFGPEPGAAGIHFGPGPGTRPTREKVLPYAIRKR